MTASSATPRRGVHAQVTDGVPPPGPLARPELERPAQLDVRGCARPRALRPGADALVQLQGGHAAARPGRGRRRHGPPPGLVRPPARPGAVPPQGLPGRPGHASGRGSAATWWRSAPAGAPRDRSPCWPTCAPGAGCSTRSACTSVPTVEPDGRPGSISPGGSRWKTRPGTSVMPTWSVPRGATASPRNSMCHRSSPRDSTTGSATPPRGERLDHRPRRARGRPAPLRRHPVPASPCRSTAAPWVACLWTTQR